MKLRAVVDTNVFVSGAISPTAAPSRVLAAWTDRRFHLVLSDDHHAELTDVFGRSWIARRLEADSERVPLLLDRLAYAERVVPSTNVPVHVRDPKDVVILAAAIGGDADYLVTGDADLLALRGEPRLGTLRIVTAAEFLAIPDAADG